jgi:hypothetical protein
MKSLIAICIFITSLQLSAQHVLQYNLTVGTEFTVEQEAKQHITQDLQGTEQVIENTLTSQMHFKVTAVNDATITLEMTFKTMKMQMSSPSLGVIMEADTANKNESDVTSNMFKATLNIPVTLIMERSGKIASISGGEKLIESMFKAANITELAQMEASRAQFEKQFGSSALSQSFEQMTYYLPAKKVKINDTWTTVFSGNLEAKNTWTLTEYSTETSKITGTATTVMSTIDENVVMILNGTQTSTITLDSKTGLFQNIVVKSENSGNAQIAAANASIPTTIKSTITYKIVQ